MKIGVVSDTHCIEKYIDIAIENLKDVDVILHLGDCSRDIKRFKEKLNKKIYGVDGNCDFKDEYPKEQTIELEGKKIFMTHGDLYGVKYGYNNIYYKGKEVGADIVLFGHSHIEMIEKMDDIILMNPGSTTIPKGKGNSMGFINIENGKITTEIKYFFS
ncbi:MAG: metallophosphoesterase [Clostridium sp.]